MGRVNRESIGNGNASTWKDYFDGLNCSLLSASISDTHCIISIGTTVSLDIYGTGFATMVPTVNGTVKSGITIGYFPNGPIIITTVCSDKTFYMQMKDAENRRQLCLFEKYDQSEYFGSNLKGDTNRGFLDIKTISLASTTSTLKHKARLGYTRTVGYIDICKETLFIDDNNISEYDNDDFISCSNVSGDMVVTFAGKNHYSVGTNLLATMN